MADTVIHTRERERVTEGGAGEWVVAVVIIAAIVVIGFMLFRAGLFSAPVSAPESANINVTLPAEGGAGEAGATE